MKCKQCQTENSPIKKTCSDCGAFLEGPAINNVTGEFGYRNSDGSFTPDIIDIEFEEVQVRILIDGHRAGVLARY